MSISRIKFQWAGARSTPGDWYLGLFGLYRRKSGRGLGLAISLRGLLAWTLGAAAAGYFGGAAYFWWKQEQRPYNFVTYSDVLLWPLSAEKRREVRALQGQAMIAEANENMREQQWGRALMNLRMGLERYPRDLSARLKLAQLFLASRLRVRAQETLMGGLEHGWPGRAYLQAAIDVAAAGEDHELVVEICDRALALHQAERHSADDLRWLVERRIRALLADRRGEEALSYAENHGAPLNSRLRAELRLLALLEAGRAADAVVEAEALRGTSRDQPEILRLHARALRETGRIDELRRLLEEIREGAPADPGAHLFSVMQTLLAGRVAEGRALLDDYVFRFGGTLGNYVLAADALAEQSLSAELEILLAAAAERGLRDSRLQLARLRVFVAKGRWTESLRLIGDFRAIPGLDAAATGLLDFYQYLVAAAADPADGAQSGFVTYIRERQLTMTAYRLAIETLRAAGRGDTARSVIIFAEGVYPSNRYLARVRVELDEQIAARRAAEEAARPSGAPAAAFAEAELFFSTLEELLSDKGPEAALTLLRDLRRAAPGWIVAEDERLARRGLEIEALRGDLPSLQAAARLYLNADRVRMDFLHGVIARSHAEGRAEEARVLLQEILRRVPGEPLASERMAVWFPPPKPEVPEEPEAVSPPPAPAPEASR